MVCGSNFEVAKSSPVIAWPLVFSSDVCCRQDNLRLGLFFVCFVSVFKNWERRERMRGAWEKERGEREECVREEWILCPMVCRDSNVFFYKAIFLIWGYSCTPMYPVGSDTDVGGEFDYIQACHVFILKLIGTRKSSLSSFIC